MMKKIALLAYNGELTCFAHVMLYALDFEKKGYEVKVVIEGAATSLITELAKTGAPFANLYSQLRDKNLLTCICKACSQKMGTLAEAEKQGLAIVGDMQGHPSIEGFVRDGYQVISF
ncbi:cytoplasmic protein [Desulfopila sp. IMCC35006]|uniref:DsrE family protein n=1 Tax=Desulfopila sp. IMCC35006 TaxID=2569542 RepID=UPI0010ABC603|nr:DsrE family protein [Desulfopila sp. IMCC35006]TKB26137.1 cytoplasmic protein [Desulfopila sp. IMCC35006]